MDTPVRKINSIERALFKLFGKKHIGDDGEFSAVIYTWRGTAYVDRIEHHGERVGRDVIGAALKEKGLL